MVHFFAKGLAHAAETVDPAGDQGNARVVDERTAERRHGG